MALKSGRVGVAPDQVDPYGRLQPTQWLIDQLRELLETADAELSAQRIAREDLHRIGLDEPIIQKPIVTPVVEMESFPSETDEEAEPEETAEAEEEAPVEEEAPAEEETNGEETE